MSKVSELGCIVCRLHYEAFRPCEIHHINGKVKKGYDLGENGQLVVCEKEQKEINLVKSLRAKGKKYKEIKSFMEKYTSRKWHYSFINKLLTRDREEQLIKNICNIELERNMCDV